MNLPSKHCPVKHFSKKLILDFHFLKNLYSKFFETFKKNIPHKNDAYENILESKAP